MFLNDNCINRRKNNSIVKTITAPSVSKWSGLLNLIDNRVHFHNTHSDMIVTKGLKKQHMVQGAKEIWEQVQN